LVHAGDHTIAELAELFSVSRATIYREIARTPKPHLTRLPAPSGGKLGRINLHV
jgi:DeoR/GlpR family transcriptional regulator of sugar metabolism